MRNQIIRKTAMTTEEKLGRKLMLELNILSYGLDDEIHLRIPGAGHIFRANRPTINSLWQGLNSYLSES